MTGLIIHDMMDRYRQVVVRGYVPHSWHLSEEAYRRLYAHVRVGLGPAAPREPPPPGPNGELGQFYKLPMRLCPQRRGFALISIKG